MKYISPDAKHKVRFIFESEIRFGPAYFRLELDNQIIAKEVFGKVVLWSEDSKYIALQRWLSTEESKGPDTTLYVIDLESLKSYSNPRVKGGFIEPIRFDNQTIIYKKVFKGIGSKEFEVNLENIKVWNEIIFV